MMVGDTSTPLVRSFGTGSTIDCTAEADTWPSGLRDEYTTNWPLRGVMW